MNNKLRLGLHLICERDAAMARARWCKANGFECFAADIAIARRWNRLLIRAMRGAA